MVSKLTDRRPRGRPREFDPDTALDRAVEVFWRLGYEGADTDTLAKAMGLAKPSVYGTFGSKEQLFLKALERYQATVAQGDIRAMDAAPTIQDGVRAFFRSMIATVTGSRGTTGCLCSCVAAEGAETMPAVRQSLALSLQQSDEALATRFRVARDRGDLPPEFPAMAKARLMTDLRIALSIRARATGGLDCPEALAQAYAALVLEGA